MQAKCGPGLELEWRSFLLRPQPGLRPRSLAEFRTYTQSWQRCATEEPEAGFQVWATDEGPPSHSVPPHLVAKAAGRLGPEAFENVHERLLDAYFSKNRDITDDGVLLDVWRQSGLPSADFESRQDPSLLDEILGQHQEAIEHGASGVPAVRASGPALRAGDHYGVLMGAQPVEVYHRWLEKLPAGSWLSPLPSELQR